MNIGAGVIDRGRAQARTWLTRSGERAAELDGHPVSHRLLLRALPRALERRFDPASARDLQAVLELRVRDPSGGAPAPFELTIAGGSCAVRRRAPRQPVASVELGAGDMIRLVSGAIGWPELLSARRLELSGDPFLALRFPLLFRLPSSAG